MEDSLIAASYVLMLHQQKQCNEPNNQPFYFEQFVPKITFKLEHDVCEGVSVCMVLGFDPRFWDLTPYLLPLSLDEMGA